jgi:hypothetical protein
MTAANTERFVAHGVALAVTSHSAALLQQAEPYLPPVRSPLPEGRVQRVFSLSETRSPDGRPVFSLRAGGRPIVSSPGVRRVLSALEWEVHLCLAERARDRIFVHAGVVEWKRKAIVVPGRSFSGKSTVVAAFVRAGCAYLSDEYAIFDPAGTCHPHPRRLSLRVDGRVEQRTAEDLGGRTHYEPLPVGCVLVTRYQRDARWQPSALSTGETVMALFEHTLAARSRAAEALAVLHACAIGVDTWHGARGDVAEFVEAILSRS